MIADHKIDDWLLAIQATTDDERRKIILKNACWNKKLNLGRRNSKRGERKKRKRSKR